MNNFDPKITLIQKLSMNIIQYAIISSNNQVFGIFPVRQNVKHPLKKKNTPKWIRLAPRMGSQLGAPRPGVSKRFLRSSKLPGRVAHDISIHQIQSQGITWDIIIIYNRNCDIIM
jgi:hypothetical protein